MPKYQRPDWVTKHLLNPIIALLVKLGMTPSGARILAVRGRKSGEWRTTPVNPLTLESGRYLVAPRGETQWVRNIRAAGGGELRAGSKREPIQVAELADDEKTEVLRACLTHWKMEAGKFFNRVTDNSSDEELRRIAPDHPVFRIVQRS